MCRSTRPSVSGSVGRMCCVSWRRGKGGWSGSRAPAYGLTGTGWRRLWTGARFWCCPSSPPPRRANRYRSTPWTAEDARATWLAPERLLLFVQVAEPDDRWEAQLKIDGRQVELRKAYSAVRRVPQTFVGFYADVSGLGADQPHRIELQLPSLKPGQFQGGFFENVEPEYTDKIGR